MNPADLATIHARAMVHSKPWSANEFQALLAQKPTLLVADDNGFLLGRLVVDEAEILTLAVDPEHQRQGIALMHLTSFEEIVARAGAKRAHLEVAVTNAPALALYQSAGYSKTGTRRNYARAKNGGSTDAFTMSKLLTHRS